MPRIHETYLACVDAYADRASFRPSEWKKRAHLLLEKTNTFLEAFFMNQPTKIAVFPDFLSSEGELLTMLEKIVKEKINQN